MFEIQNKILNTDFVGHSSGSVSTDSLAEVFPDSSLQEILNWKLFHTKTTSLQ